MCCAAWGRLQASLWPVDVGDIVEPHVCSHGTANAMRVERSISLAYYALASSLPKLFHHLI